MKTVETPPTRQLQEQINKPLHAQKVQPQDNGLDKSEDKKTLLTFDDTDDSPVIYGKDLEVPAFIRRQHD